MRMFDSLAIGLILAGLAAAPAVAGGWGGRYGVAESSATWSYRQAASETCPQACRPVAAITLPGGFFAGYGGVGGFEEADFGGGGGFVFTSAGAHAFASASASARARVSLSLRAHGGVHGHHGCGCR